MLRQLPSWEMTTCRSEVRERKELFRSSRCPALGYWVCVLAALGVAVALRWPVMRTGFYLDDYIQLEMLRGHYPVPRHPLDLFNFTRGAVDNDILRRAGFLPWWSSPQVKLALFRPLASALIWLDLRMFGHDPMGYHLHTLGWWVAFVVLFAAVLQRIQPRPAALLALVFVLAHPAHTILLGWLASRNAIVASVFVLLGLWLQLGSRTRVTSAARVTGVAMAGLSYCVAMLTSEYALALLPYPASFSCLQYGFNSRTFWRRAAGWAAFVLVCIGIRSALGYGAQASGMYIDPLADPVAYLQVVWVRLPTAASDVVLAMRSSWLLVGFPWPDVLLGMGVSPEVWPLCQIGFGVVAIALASALAKRLLRDRVRVRFVVLAIPFTFLPLLSTLPDSRIVLPPLLGWSTMLAQWLWTSFNALKRDRQSMANRLSFVSGAALWMLGTLAPPFYSAQEIRDLPRLAGVVRAGVLDPGLDDLIANQSVLLVAAAEPTTFLLPMVRSWNDRVVPSEFQVLGQTIVPQIMERLSDNSFALEDVQVPRRLLAVPDAFNRAGLRAGQVVVEDGMRVTVERAVEGRAVRTRFDMARPLRSYVVLTQTPSGLQRVKLPEIGDSIEIEPPTHSVDLSPQP